MNKRSTPIYKRIVVKAGTNVLTNRSNALDSNLMGSLVSQMAELRSENHEILLVTSGAIAAGKEILGREEEGRSNHVCLMNGKKLDRSILPSSGMII